MHKGQSRVVITFICTAFGAATLAAGCRGEVSKDMSGGQGQTQTPVPQVPVTTGPVPQPVVPKPAAMTPVMTTTPGMTPVVMMPGMMVPVPPVVMMPPVNTDEMPPAVVNLLRARCAGCHSYGQADPAGWGSVLDLSRMIDADIVVAGNPGESRMIDRVAVAGNMPPQGPRLTGDEVMLLKGWITNLKRVANNPPSDDDVLDLIAGDQLALRGRSSDFRYVSFAHYVGQGRLDAEMKELRQVLTFAINSLSRRGAIADLPTIDSRHSIFRIDLAALGWNAALWDTLTSFYPYCIQSDIAAHEALYAQLGTEAPVVRGDWFLATATTAPLYDILVDLPNTVDQLATRLGININDDINHPGLAEPDNLVRVGFRRSAVALHNRLIERHLGAAGQYLWLTYDFDSSVGDSDLLANPLGPANRDRQKFVHTFQNVAGEVIFTLPNGLQGYMLVDGTGRKVSAAGINVVRDKNRRDAVVTNGLSCIGCHAGPGIVKPRQMDEVPLFTDTHIAQFLGRELQEVEVTYPRALMPDVFNQDAGRYRAIADSAPGGAPLAAASDYSTFITAVGQYESNVGFHGAASDFSQEYNILRESILANDSQNVSLPRNNQQPLLLRDDFVCVWRDLITKIRANAVFCAKTFDAAAVRNACATVRK
jgi:hypothetical protein